MLMNPEVCWMGAVPQEQLMQKHDKQLLCHELEQGAIRPPVARIRRKRGGAEMI